MRFSSAKQTRPAPARTVRRLLEKFILGGGERIDPKKGRLLLETLEQRQLMAGDMDLLFTDAANSTASNSVASQTSSSLQTATQAEGESAPDLVQFAKDLADAGVVFYGANWCPVCTSQKQLFSDGGEYLPFVEVTKGDRSLNPTGVAEGIQEFPTWDFPNGTRLIGLQTLATLSATANVPIPQGDQPTFLPIGPLTDVDGNPATPGHLVVRTGSPLHVPIDAYDPGDGPLTVTVSVGNPALLEATVLTGNRSIRIDMDGYGDMVFELFEDRAPVASGRVIELAESGFYDGIIFHRVVDGFVIQAGDPTGTGTSGSTLGNFDDEFNAELQHNREGVLSFAKSSDDTNNSQFFVTETPTRSLDFNHSVFGQLIEGFDVREAISGTAVNNSTQNKPINDVTINTIDVFNDTENGLVMLKAVGNATGTTTVTFTVTDANGNSYSETVNVTVAADNSNSLPFLNPITSPVSGTAGTPATLQLSSVDVEGDPVFYTARAVTGAASGTVTVNSTTGLVTVTPAAGFSGPFVVNVGVSDGAITASQTPDDNQRVTFNIAAANTVATPLAIDLQTGSDSGSSNIDNITNMGSLTFRVSGVTDGATVEIINTVSGSVIGTGIANASTVVITTNNISALGNGSYTLAARQRVGTNTSGLSPILTLVYDNTIPVSVVGSASTQANVGRAYQTDLISPEEGSGLIYAFANAPTGATVNATTGVITWTPTSAQLGANNFSLTLTDVAGNVRTETLTVNVAGAPLAEVKLQVTDLAGNAISSIAVNQEFLLKFIGVDARSFNKPGVYSAYADILFDGTLIEPVPGSTIQYDADFTVVPKGAFSTGLIDELGAVNNRIVASNEAESLIATVRMRALASGTVNIRSEPADESDSDVLLFGQDDQVPAETVAYGSVSLSIGQTFTVGADTFTVAEDSAATNLNVLANDSITSGTGSLSVVSVTQPASGGTVTLTGGVVRFTPTANFNGTSVFTYRVADGGGVQQNGSVTVTVTPVNDAPDAVGDTLTVDQGSSNNSLNVLANDTFAPDSGETLTITAVGATTAGGTVTIASGSKAVLYTPPAGFIGTDSFTYTISDGTLTDTATVSLTVRSADAPPTAVADAFTVTEDAAEAVFGVMSNDTRDASNQAFTLSSVGTPSKGGTARISADGTQFFYRPAANFAGTETVTYTIKDTGGGVATGTVTFTVTPVNDVPPILNVTVPRNRGGAAESTVFQLSDLPANVDTGETLTISTVSTSTTAGGTARIDTATQTIRYTPPSADFVGADSITYSISDGTLTSNGTLTITVSDYASRDFYLEYDLASASSYVNGLMLRGTNLLNQTVEQGLTFGSAGALFADLLPGSYVIDVPAIPFLQNASAPQQISIESAAEDGDMTVQLDVGQLKAQYISIRDWLGKAPSKSLLVAVAPGQSGVLVVPSSKTDTISTPRVELDASGANLTIRGNSIATTTTPSQAVQASVSAVSNRNVQARGEIEGLKLFRINVAADAVTFAPSSTATTTTTTTTTGSTAALQSVAPESSNASVNTLSFGDSQPEAESFAASSLTLADVGSLVSSDVNTRTDATVLSLQDGDLWVGTTLNGSPQEEKLTDTSSIDSAMQNVAQSLTLISQTAENLAGKPSLNADAIDRVLGSEL